MTVFWKFSREIKANQDQSRSSGKSQSRPGRQKYVQSCDTIHTFKNYWGIEGQFSTVWAWLGLWWEQVRRKLWKIKGWVKISLLRVKSIIAFLFTQRSELSTFKQICMHLYLRLSAKQVTESDKASSFPLWKIIMVWIKEICRPCFFNKFNDFQY